MRRIHHQRSRGRGARGLRRVGRRPGWGVARRVARAAPAPWADPRPPDLLRAPFRDVDAALPAPAVRRGLRARPRHDPVGVVHDEAERDDRNGAGGIARFRRCAPICTARDDAGLSRADRRARGVARRGHRLRQGLGPAERRQPGRAGRASRHPRLPRGARRTRARHLPHSVERARDQRGLGRDGRHACRRRRCPQRRNGRSGRARGEVPRTRDAAGGDHGDLPLDARRLRRGHRPRCATRCTATAARSTSTAPT